MTSPGCRKRRYRRRVDALIALANIQWHDKSTRAKQEQRAYHCLSCHGWHLTSQRRRRASTPHPTP